MLNILAHGAKGDGRTDDTDAFRRAMDVEPCVYVPGGRSFVVNDLVIESAKLWGRGTLIHGGGKGAVVLTGFRPRIEGIGFKSGSTRPGYTNVRIAEGAVDAAVVDCWFDANCQNAIAADDDVAPNYKTPVDGLTVAGCSIRGYMRPIVLASVRRVVIDHCMIRESQYDAIRLRQRVDDIRITHNWFREVGTAKSNLSQDAVDCCWSGCDLMIAWNDIDGAAKYGLDIKGDLNGDAPKGDRTTENVRVLWNRIRRTQHAAIAMEGSAERMILRIEVAHNDAIECCLAAEVKADYWIKRGVDQALIADNRGTVRVSGKNGAVSNIAGR